MEAICGWSFVPGMYVLLLPDVSAQSENNNTHCQEKQNISPATIKEESWKGAALPLWRRNLQEPIREPNGLCECCFPL